MNITICKIMSILWERGIGDVQFCESIGINKSSLADWKRGKTKSYTKHISKIASALGVTPEYLLSETDTITEDEDNLLKTFRSLDKELQTIALGRITELKRGIAQNAIISAPERGAPEFSGELFPVGVSVGANVE
ncbi:MAG: helix-turn-helix transcriptional regulator [Oscillospiraceae bacterium]|jgi:transcriptional regulator with XRE-family HTH domain|nr:helix-turn-helix transcriptional regulator [Oscillospiraceae bacterium]